MIPTTGSRPLHIPGRMVCAVCGRVLEEYENIGYAHARVDEVGDHIAVPVADVEIPVNERCDFCFANSTEWLLPAENFQLPVERAELFGTVGIEEPQPYMSNGAWGACGPCGDLIAAERWPLLLRRVRDEWPGVHSGNTMPERIYPATYRLYNELRKHITGPLVRLVS